MGPSVTICAGKMPTLDCPGDNSPGQFGPRIRTQLSRANACARAMSSTGTPSVIATTKRDAGVHGFQNGIGCERWRYVHDRRVGTRVGNRFVHRVEDRDRRTVGTFKGLPALTRG